MATITGTPLNDNGLDEPALIGTDGDDVIAGMAGDDLIEGLAGNDFLSPGFGIDTVLGGAGDDRVLHSGGAIGMTGVWDGGEGVDRLLLDPAGGTFRPFPIKDIEFRNFERIDLNGNGLILRVEQLAGIDQVTGFGARGLLSLVGGGTVDLGAITVGEDGTGVGRVRFYDTVRSDFTWDASAAESGWELSAQHHLRSSDAVGQLLGGSGNDTLFGEQGDTLRGGAGDDVLRFYPRTRDPFSVLDGGNGQDTVVGTHGTFERAVFENVEVFFGSASLRASQFDQFERFEYIGGLSMATPGTVDLSGKITSVAFRDRGTDAEYFIFSGSDNHDTITWTDTRFRIDLNGGIGADTLTTGAGNDIIDGGWGDDLIRSGDGSDFLRGGDGDDRIIAWGTDADMADVVEGGAGSDYIEGGAGNDRLYGYTTWDANHADGSNTIYGGDGADFIMGAGGDDFLYGGSSEQDLADVINGLDGDDSIEGGHGNDSLLGGNGADTILGGAGSDTMQGHADDDLLVGGAGADLIFGGPGDDFLNGGFGSDRLNGGAGADRFFHALVEGHGSDWIQDFTAEDALVAADGASAGDFQVNIANTPNAGAADVAEAFVIYRPTGQILWALVDGAALDTITLRIDEIGYDLTL